MSVPTPTSSYAEIPSRRRRIGISILLWVYGISITIFLFSLWGRAVIADTSLLSGAASRMADSEIVSTRIQAWFEDALDEVGLGETADTVAPLVMALPEVRAATGSLVSEIVRVAAGPSGSGEVDVASVYRPAVPAVTAAVASAGVPVSEEQVESVVERLDPPVVRPGESPPLVGSASPAVRSLTVATLVALFVMVASGAWSVLLSRDRRAMTRSLLNRLAVSGFTYAVFFQVSSWVLDPGGGRASARGALAQVVGSKLWIPLLLAVVATAGGWAFRHRHLRKTEPGDS